MTLCVLIIEDRFRLDLAQADIGPGVGRHGPREAPAVAVEHRQRPQVDRVVRHAPGDDVADRVQVRAAVVVDDALRIAGGARGVVERDRVPFVAGPLPGEFRVASAEQLLVGLRAQALARARVLRVVDVDDPASPLASPAPPSPSAKTPGR